MYFLPSDDGEDLPLGQRHRRHPCLTLLVVNEEGRRTKKLAGGTFLKADATAPFQIDCQNNFEFIFNSWLHFWRHTINHGRCNGCNQVGRTDTIDVSTRHLTRRTVFRLLTKLYVPLPIKGQRHFPYLPSPILSRCWLIQTQQSYWFRAGCVERLTTDRPTDRAVIDS